MPKPSRQTATDDASAESKIVRTSGQIFADGELIELVASASDNRLDLLFWNKQKKIIAPRVKYGDRICQAPDVIARRRCVVTTCRITTDDDKHIVLRSFDEGSRLCKFDYLDFPQEEVLNCRIENGLRFHHPGDMVEGTILAMGIIPISQPYVHFKLTFEDSLDNEVRFRGLLSVDRAAKPRRQTVSKETDLYGPSNASKTKVVVSENFRQSPKRQKYADSTAGNVPSGGHRHKARRTGTGTEV